MATPQRKTVSETECMPCSEPNTPEVLHRRFCDEVRQEAETIAQLALDMYERDGDRGGTGPLGVLKAAATKRDVQKNIARIKSRQAE